MGPWARRCSLGESSPRPRPRFGGASTWSPKGRRSSAQTSNAYCSAASVCARWKVVFPPSSRGKDKPAAADCLDLAELCFVKNHYATAARLYAEALTANRTQLTEDLRAGHRFNAARAAALAGGGHGDDVAGLGEPEREALRKQARDWLRLDWPPGPRRWTPARRRIASRLGRRWRTWRDDPDLAGLRDPAALGKLRPAERQECGKLWGDIDALIDRLKRPG